MSKAPTTFVPVTAHESHGFTRSSKPVYAHNELGVTPGYHVLLLLDTAGGPDHFIFAGFAAV